MNFQVHQARVAVESGREPRGVCRVVKATHVLPCWLIHICRHAQNGQRKPLQVAGGYVTIAAVPDSLGCGAMRRDLEVGSLHSPKKPRAYSVRRRLRAFPLRTALIVHLEICRGCVVAFTGYCPAISGAGARVWSPLDALMAPSGCTLRSLDDCPRNCSRDGHLIKACNGVSQES